MEHEIHLFIIWENGRAHEKPILDDIKLNFEVLKVYGVTWSPYLVDKNFTRFYGQNLPKNSHKAQHCGGGEFLLIIVRDKNPRYDNRDTTKGIKLVNSNIFDAKARYREISGGGHRIHGTNNIGELKHDLVLLTGKSLSDFEIYLKENGSTEVEPLQKDLIGTNGWASFSELFYVLNECSAYLVLRNVENINIKYFLENKGDVDLLAQDKSEVLYVLGNLESIDKEDGHMYVDVSKRLIPFEVYETNQNLFPEKFEDELFRNKKMTGNIYHPDEMLSFLGLIYHSLLLNRTFTNKHRLRLTTYAERLEISREQEIGKKKYLKILIDFFIEHGYVFSQPNDNTIYFNKRKEILENFQNNTKRKSFLSLKLSKIIRYSQSRRCLTFTILAPFRNVFYLKTFLPRLYSIVILVGSKDT
jgi:hypothetical protein